MTDSRSSSNTSLQCTASVFMTGYARMMKSTVSWHTHSFTTHSACDRAWTNSHCSLVIAAWNEHSTWTWVNSNDLTTVSRTGLVSSNRITGIMMMNDDSCSVAVRCESVSTASVTMRSWHDTGTGSVGCIDSSTHSDSSMTWTSWVHQLIMSSCEGCILVKSQWVWQIPWYDTHSYEACTDRVQDSSCMI